MLGAMAIQRMDHVSVVVDDLEAATAFFAELGRELEGKAPVEGRWVDRINGLDGVRVDIVMMRTPDGHGRLEPTKLRTPAAVSAEPGNAPLNTLGLRSIMFPDGGHYPGAGDAVSGLPDRRCTHQARASAGVTG